MFERYSMLARQTIFASYKDASAAGSAAIDTEHLLSGILLLDPTLPGRCGARLSREAVVERTLAWHAPGSPIPPGQDLPLTRDAREVLSRAPSLADQYHSREIRTEHLLLSMLLNPACHAAELLLETGADEKTLRRITEDLKDGEAQPGNDAAYWALAAALQNPDNGPQE